MVACESHRVVEPLVVVVVVVAVVPVFKINELAHLIGLQDSAFVCTFHMHVKLKLMSIDKHRKRC